MKRLFFLLAFVASVALVNAQVPSTALTFGNVKSYWEYGSTAADTACVGTNKDYTWGVPRDDIYFYLVEADLDEGTNGGNCIAILYGSLNGSDFTEIDTLATVAAVESQSADATVLLADLSTGVVWRYMKLTLIVSTAGDWRAQYIRCRYVGKND